MSEALVNNGFDCALLSAHAVTITSLRNHLLLSWLPDTPEILHQYSPLSLYSAGESQKLDYSRSSGVIKRSERVSANQLLAENIFSTNP